MTRRKVPWSSATATMSVMVAANRQALAIPSRMSRGVESAMAEAPDRGKQDDPNGAPPPRAAAGHCADDSCRHLTLFR